MQTHEYDLKFLPHGDQKPLPRFLEELETEGWEVCSIFSDVVNTAQSNLVPPVLIRCFFIVVRKPKVQNGKHSVISSAVWP